MLPRLGGPGRAGFFALHGAQPLRGPGAPRTPPLGAQAALRHAPRTAASARAHRALTPVTAAWALRALHGNTGRRRGPQRGELTA